MRYRRSSIGLLAAWLYGTSAYAQTPQGAGRDDTGVLILLFIVFIIYFVPTVVAFSRRHPNRWMIAVINIVFGGTGFGWLGSLVWALNAIHKSAEGSNGGESGLNLFVNDTKKIELTQTPLQAQSRDSVLEQLKKLKALHEQGILTDDELTRMKRPLLEALL